MKLICVFVAYLFGTKLRSLTCAVLTLSAFALSPHKAQAQETITWASGSPTSPESGWIQGAGTLTIQNKKVLTIGVIMYAKKGENEPYVVGNTNLANNPKTWDALLVGLEPG